MMDRYSRIEAGQGAARIRWPFGSRRAREAAESASGSLSQLLFISARPGAQFLWTLLFLSTLFRAAIDTTAYQPTMIIVLVVSYGAVVLGNHYFPYDEYHPLGFFGLMCAYLLLISSLIFFTGNRTSLLSFLFFLVPIYAAHYYSYPGTMAVALVTTLARFAPFLSGSISSIVGLTLGLSAATYFVVGIITCYIVESEKIYGRKSQEFHKLLEISRNRESEVSLLCGLSKMFPRTLDLESALQTTADLAARSLSADGAFLLLIDHGDVVLRASAGPVVEDATIVPEVLAAQDWFTSLIGGHNVLERRVPLVWLERHDGPFAGRGSVAAVPLYMGRQETGCIICFAGAQETFGDFHLDVLASLASQTAISIENAGMYTRALDEKAKVETILSALHDGLLVTDSNGGLVHANPLAQRMLGFDSNSYGEGLHPLLSKSVSNSDLGVYSVAGALNAALLGVPVFGEMEVPGEAGGSFQANYVPLKDREGTVSGVALFLHDITEFKRLEQMRTDFVSNVSHELRTPLTSIVGYVSILLSGAAGELSRQQADYLGVVSEQTANLSTMIEELLELSRMVAHGEGIQGEAVGISSVVEASMRQLGDQADEKGVTIEVHIPESLPDVNGDAARLVHVLTNIISNAIKFTDRGGEIELVALKNDACVQVQVSDSGCGISPSYLPHIFDRFFRAHAGTPNMSGGFGLGLAICREIIELHGGRIWAESQVGRGSTFYFTVPIREVRVSGIQP